ncbi:hypothetical protein COCNU_06G006060 [Cocos nucifera]|uniref:Pentatricopeptide repeat-containing protein n=1 Tax=Cocos nucifera TaxID=13894 RepID=A0A8K0N364_COCNU|nr:hypothetical protein COCNU_06G006060 [Cocos nucifera]
MYARCGHVQKAREVFDGLQERNVVAWTAMISGYGMHGYGNKAVELFHRMKTEGPLPNDVTFVAVLSACAHFGLVSEGREVFKSMKRDYGLAPRIEHHVCMVDMFGRAGLLDEAVRFIRDWIPGEPGPEVWTAMLGACKMHKDFDLGVEVAERLLAIEPENPAHYVLLSNLYALAGMMDQVEKIRQAMIRRGLKKNTGFIYPRAKLLWAPNGLIPASVFFPRVDHSISLKGWGQESIQNTYSEKRRRNYFIELELMTSVFKCQEGSDWRG